MILSSDVARLVLGYLQQEELTNTCHTFVEESPYLAEYAEFARREGIIPFSLPSLFGHSLKIILDEYAEIKARELVTDTTNALCSLWKKLEFDIGRIKNCQKGFLFRGQGGARVRGGVVRRGGSARAFCTPHLEFRRPLDVGNPRTINTLQVESQSSPDFIHHESQHSLDAHSVSPACGSTQLSPSPNSTSFHSDSDVDVLPTYETPETLRCTPSSFPSIRTPRRSSSICTTQPTSTSLSSLQNEKQSFDRKSSVLTPIVSLASCGSEPIPSRTCVALSTSPASCFSPGDTTSSVSKPLTQTTDTISSCVVSTLQLTSVHKNSPVLMPTSLASSEKSSCSLLGNISDGTPVGPASRLLHGFGCNLLSQKTHVESPSKRNKLVVRRPPVTTASVPFTTTTTDAVDERVPVDPKEVEAEILPIFETARETLLANSTLQEKLAQNINRIVYSSDICGNPLAEDPVLAVEQPQDSSAAMEHNSLNELLNVPVCESHMTEEDIQNILDLTESDPAFHTLFGLFNFGKQSGEKEDDGQFVEMSQDKCVSGTIVDNTTDEDCICLGEVAEDRQSPLRKDLQNEEEFLESSKTSEDEASAAKTLVETSIEIEKKCPQEGSLEAKELSNLTKAIEDPVVVVKPTVEDVHSNGDAFPLRKSPIEKSDAVPQLDVGLHKSRTTTGMRKAMTPRASLGPTVDNPGKGSRANVAQMEGNECGDEPNSKSDTPTDIQLDQPCATTFSVADVQGPTLVIASVHTSATIQTTSPAMQLPNLSMKPHGNSDPSSVQQVEKSDTNNEVRVDCVEEFPDVGVEVCLGDDVQDKSAEVPVPPQYLSPERPRFRGNLHQIKKIAAPKIKAKTKGILMPRKSSLVKRGRPKKAAVKNGTSQNMVLPVVIATEGSMAVSDQEVSSLNKSSNCIIKDTITDEEKGAAGSSTVCCTVGSSANDSLTPISPESSQLENRFEGCLTEPLDTRLGNVNGKGALNSTSALQICDEAELRSAVFSITGENMPLTMFGSPVSHCVSSHFGTPQQRCFEVPTSLGFRQHIPASSLATMTPVVHTSLNCIDPVQASGSFPTPSADMLESIYNSNTDPAIPMSNPSGDTLQSFSAMCLSDANLQTSVSRANLNVAGALDLTASVSTSNTSPTLHGVDSTSVTPQRHSANGAEGPSEGFMIPELLSSPVQPVLQGTLPEISPLVPTKSTSREQSLPLISTHSHVASTGSGKLMAGPPQNADTLVAGVVTSEDLLCKPTSTTRRTSVRITRSKESKAQAAAAAKEFLRGPESCSAQEQPYRRVLHFNGDVAVGNETGAPAGVRKAKSVPIDGTKQDTGETKTQQRQSKSNLGHGTSASVGTRCESQAPAENFMSTVDMSAIQMESILPLESIEPVPLRNATETGRKSTRLPSTTKARPVRETKGGQRHKKHPQFPRMERPVLRQVVDVYDPYLCSELSEGATLQASAPRQKQSSNETGEAKAASSKNSGCKSAQKSVNQQNVKNAQASVYSAITGTPTRSRKVAGADGPVVERLRRQATSGGLASAAENGTPRRSVESPASEASSESSINMAAQTLVILSRATTMSQTPSKDVKSKSPNHPEKATCVEAAAASGLSRHGGERMDTAKSDERLQAGMREAGAENAIEKTNKKSRKKRAWNDSSKDITAHESAVSKRASHPKHKRQKLEAFPATTDLDRFLSQLSYME
uniref:LisH domain-containing protein n=1 Tax=Eptatretus burgeri TaxID=7764 RepID=A0A8C4NDF9_EPTBU